MYLHYLGKREYSKQNKKNQGGFPLELSLL